MRGFKRAFRYGALSMKQEFREPGFYVVTAVVFCIILYCFGGVADCLRESGDRMNVMELYVFVQSNRVPQTLYLIGVIAFSCGTLFYSNGAAYYLVRANRREWMRGQVIYLAFWVVCYNLFLILALGIAVGGRITFQNEWSYTSVLASQFGMQSIGIYMAGGISRAVLGLSPFGAGAWSFLLSVLIGMVTGMMMVCCSQRNKGVYGVAVILVAWFVDIIIDEVPWSLSWLPYLSPYGGARLNSLMGNEIPMVYAVCFLGLLLAIEVYALLRLAGQIDFVKLE